MTSTPRTTSTADARKCNEERRLHEVTADQMRVAEESISDAAVFSRPTTDLPPVLPDTSGWVKRAPGDVIEAGTPYVARDAGATAGGPLVQWKPDGRTYAWTVEKYHMTIWTPPPVPREPWRVISTDRDKPTLAKVTWDSGVTQTANVYRDSRNDVRDEWEMKVGSVSEITDVTPLHTYDPVTHLPVERALIDEWLRDEPMIVSGIRRDMQCERTPRALGAAMSDQEVIERAAEVMNDHSADFSGGPFAIGCGGCGGSFPTFASHDRHVADALAAAGLLAGGVPGRSEAEIKAEALREAADDLEASQQLAVDFHGNRFAVCGTPWLRARAARVAGTTEAGDEA